MAKRYRVKLFAEFEIECENVAVAHRLAKCIRAKGERIGWSERDRHYSIKRVQEKKSLPKRE